MSGPLQELEIATELLASATKIAQAWINRFIVVNVAHFSALGVMLTWRQPEKLEVLAWWMSLGICASGVIASFVLFGVTLRQLRWIGRQLNLVYSLQEKHNVKVHVEREQFGFLQTTFIYVMGVAVLAAWIAVAWLIVEKS